MKQKETIILETMVGNEFRQVAIQAKQLTTSKQDVQFDFNGITCNVTRKTDVSYLYRDYINAWIMGWEEIGQYSHLEHYPEDVQAELVMKKAEGEERQRKQEEEWRKKDEAERLTFEQKTEGVEVEIVDVDKYNEWKAKNTDGYGAGIFEYAEGWAKLMQVEMKNGKTLEECASPTSYELGFMGITGFMYGAAVSILASCWKHGEQLRKWHNKEYDHEGDGVVNPAVLTIG